ncbi:hypothetical protein [Kitasatospora sp. NPDC098663]|uniref:hypothetical protein n=1 Tax=Kitasatospora sp. NPDC098663 TaxID=3364096 RepID=UPI00382E376B
MFFFAPIDSAIPRPQAPYSSSIRRISMNSPSGVLASSATCAQKLGHGCLGGDAQSFRELHHLGEHVVPSQAIALATRYPGVWTRHLKDGREG